MIDPSNITNFNATDEQLEEVLIFWVLVAGKTAFLISRSLEQILNSLEGSSPFEKIRGVGEKNLPELLKSNGIGCHSVKSKYLWHLVTSGIDPRTCSLDELESIYGIGPKTARCFLIHSRAGAKYAGLDTHILKFLRAKGHDIPKHTPSTKKQYRQIENIFLGYVKKSKKSVSEFDLEIWRSYAKNGGKSV